MIPPQGDNALRWTLCALAVLATAGRFYLSHLHSKPHRLDSLFNILALLCLIAINVILVLSPNFIDPVIFLRIYLSTFLLLWTTLYLVKAAFLTLCWYIFCPSSSFRKAWYVTTAFTFLTYWPITLSQLWQCKGDPTKWDDPTTCAEFISFGANWDGAALATMDAVLHAASDLLILSLPLPFVHRLQMSRAQKISVSAVFVIISVDIVTGILRNVASACAIAGYSIDVSVTITDVMQNVEPGLAVIVCTLPSYGVLLRPSRRRNGRYGKVHRNANCGDESGIAKLKCSEVIVLREMPRAESG